MQPRASSTDPFAPGPIRGEILGFERLTQRLRDQAQALEVAPRPHLRQLLLPRLAANRRALQQARAQFDAATRRGKRISPAAEWLLDNSHLIEEHIRQTQRDLSIGYYRALPKLAHGSYRGYPRVYALTIEIIAGTDSAVDRQTLETCVQAFQSVSVLTSGELWAIPIMLRLGLIENLRRLMDRSAAAQEVRETADQAAANFEVAAVSTGAVESIAAGIPLRSDLDAVFTVEMLERLRDLGPRATEALLWLEQRLAARGTDSETVVRLEHQLSAANRVTAGNIVTSLRALGSIDWRLFFEAVSGVEAVLRRDPSGVYPQMDMATRDRYRHAVERLSRRTQLPEIEVASRALALATASGSAHVGSFLFGRDREHLERDLGDRHHLGERALAWAAAHAAALYVVVVCGTTLLATIALAAQVIGLQGSPWMAAVAFAVALVPVSALVVNILHSLVAGLWQPRILPKLDFAAGIPDSCRTMVVIPVLITSPQEVRELIVNLEIRFLGNRDPQLHFALLTDFTDAASSELPGDAAVLASARAGIERLNEKHAIDRKDRFHLFHRQRRWNASDGIWMGWERKRGKLLEFNRLLRGAKDTTFVLHVGNSTILPHIKYVLTLDADTELPPGSAHGLVGAIAHPLNHPRLDAAKRRVVEGYGIVQPRTSVTARAAMSSRLAQLFAGDIGLSPYASAVSSVYQDLFGSSTYVGKAIYDVDVMDAVLRDRFPENRLLSHDLLEGAYARTALATDLQLLEGFPSSFDAYEKREHRWIRGDWQILDWLLPWVPDASGRRIRNVLPLLDRWKILDNLRRSLVLPGVVLLAAAGWLILPGSPWLWTAVSLLVLLFPFLSSATGSANHRPLGESWRAYLWAVADRSILEGKRAFWTLAFAPTGAIRNLDAIGRALVRRAITRRNLLEWQHSAAVEGSSARGPSAYWRRLWPGSAFAATCVCALILVAPLSLVVVAPILLVWMIAPLLADVVSRPHERRIEPLTAVECDRLRAVARRMWSYYETFAGAEDHWLPPDNYQEEPRGIVAHRTSPTNIAFLLLGGVAAHDLGFLDLATLASSCERTFSTLDRLDRHRGHFLNWYDTVSLQPLIPAYVSTADSGNLAAALLVIHHAFGELAATVDRRGAVEGDLADRLRVLAARARGLYEDMDFRFLFDEQRMLFTVGYNLTAQQPDSSHYDLLASEARLASFIAIARHQVPPQHWFRLGRPLTRDGRRLAVLAWGGTMFEYLMPALLMRDLNGTLLRQSYDSVVHRQMAHGVRHGIPWGVSESGFYAVDFQQNYQYRMFGIPELALRRDLGEDLVVAPYATFLALPFAPRAASRNLESLEAEGLLGQYGFYEAIDYTPTRRPRDRRGSIVRSYMAHHVGMSLVAIANALQADRMQRCFHAEPAIAATEALLQEELPLHAPLTESRFEAQSARPLRSPVGASRPGAARALTTPHTPAPRAMLLSNGNYAVMVTNAGGGFSATRDLVVTRWRADAVRDHWGSFVTVRDLGRDTVWSATHQPALVETQDYEVSFGIEKAEFCRHDFGVETTTEIIVSPQDDLEIRRIGLTTRHRMHCELELTSYAEVVLDAARTDLAHPAFSKLFVQSEVVRERQALLFWRRPRDSDHKPVWAFHQMILEDAAVEGFEWETDRAQFLGRGRTPEDALALHRPLSGTTGAILDPIMSLRGRVTLVPDRTTRLAFVTGVASSREEALARCDTYSDFRSLDRTFDLAGAHGQIELRHLGITADMAQNFQRMASRILFEDSAMRVPPDVRIRNTRDRNALWSYGISGDHPLVVVCIRDASELELVREALLAHEFWRRRGLTVDLVLWNEYPTGYADELQNSIQAVADTSLSRPYLDRSGGVFLRRADHWREEDQVLLMTLARVILKCELGGFTEQLKRPLRLRTPVRSELARAVPSESIHRADASALSLPKNVLFDNGFGGFSHDGREYIIRLEPDHWPPTPWINVLANPRFGCLASDAGLGTTWSRNSQQHRLTPWSNDPVSDPPSEALYVCDEDSGQVWSPMALPVRTESVHRVRHGAGYTVYEHTSHGIDLQLCTFVAVDDPVKILHLRLRNRSDGVRRLGVVHTAEWVLGTSVEITRPFLVTEFDAVTHAIFARNTSKPHGVAFTAASAGLRDWTTDRDEFYGRNGTASRPRGLSSGLLQGRVGADVDPCAVLRCNLVLEPGAMAEQFFVLGEGHDADDARALIRRYTDPERARAELAAVQHHWDALLGAVQITTPDRRLDLLVNRWLPYQTLACRLWGRSAFYQSGGAYGFRDQLQDVMGLVHAAPDLVREHLLRAAAHQFREGDVQHWWHEPDGQGVRTRCSDDLLWLPFATHHYVATSGDAAVLDEVVPFLEAPELESGQPEAYLTNVVSGPGDSLYEHCVRALDRSDRTGEHGLPLIGGGDWNDGMNRLGHLGRGESVWLGWFAYRNLMDFAALAARRRDPERAAGFERRAAALRQALDQSGWDGAWYRRAYDDEGRAIGSAANRDCRIDSIAQSWAVLSGAAPQGRARAAMAALEQSLVRPADRLILLLDPPFDFHGSDPGYIQGYVPGVRENGGQYTHAAIWAIWAQALLGDADGAHAWLRLLNPIHQTATPADVARYKVEPYVVAADVYSEPSHLGRGGWTWYTGSAAWMLRLAVEGLLGLQVQGDRMQLAPRLPSDWPGFQLTYRRGTTSWEVRVEVASGAEETGMRCELDGATLEDGAIPLARDGKVHRVRVVLGRAPSAAPGAARS